LKQPKNDISIVAVAAGAETLVQATIGGHATFKALARCCKPT
jgi:hypothetical protein